MLFNVLVHYTTPTKHLPCMWLYAPHGGHGEHRGLHLDVIGLVLHRDQINRQL